MDNKPIVFSALVSNTEVIEEITQFKILSDFLSSSLLYCYQNIGKDMPENELKTIESKLSQYQVIVQRALNEFR